ncbi:hypothetical protein C8T65DRAFT_695746 [Cerioporus squamosus]|nr:hypothetical protein C8T65DRAFT_695746 [Cerioporus squamosus]
MYNRSQAAISEIVNLVVMFVNKRWNHLLDFNHGGLLSPANLNCYAAAIHCCGAPLATIWGFIDYTLRAICCPWWFQQQAYSGHKRKHALKFQAVMLPCGLFGHLYAACRLMEKCQKYAACPGDHPGKIRHLQVFGDPAYGILQQLISPYVDPTPDQRAWNLEMLKMQMAVEHEFGIVSSLFPFLNVGWKMCLFESPVSCYYHMCIHLLETLQNLTHLCILSCLKQARLLQDQSFSSFQAVQYRAGVTSNIPTATLLRRLVSRGLVLAVKTSITLHTLSPSECCIELVLCTELKVQSEFDPLQLKPGF